MAGIGRDAASQADTKAVFCYSRQTRMKGGGMTLTVDCTLCLAHQGVVSDELIAAYEEDTVCASLEIVAVGCRAELIGVGAALECGENGAHRGA